MVRLDEGGSAEVAPGKVMISVGLRLAVLAESFRVSSQLGLFNLKCVVAILNGVVGYMDSGLESLVLFEGLLEVDNVLSGVTEVFLHQTGLNLGKLTFL